MSRSERSAKLSIASFTKPSSSIEDVTSKENTSESDPCRLDGAIGVAELQPLRRQRTRVRRWGGVCMVRLVRRCIVLVRGWGDVEGDWRRGGGGGRVTWRDTRGEDMLVVEEAWWTRSRRGKRLDIAIRVHVLGWVRVVGVRQDVFEGKLFWSCATSCLQMPYWQVRASCVCTIKLCLMWLDGQCFMSSDYSTPFTSVRAT